MSQEITRASAKELTPEEAEARAKLCYELEAEVKAALAEGRSALWRLGKACYEFEQQRGWGPLGYDNRTDWLADPEIAMTAGTYYRLRDTYEALVIDRSLPIPALESLDTSKVHLVLPAIETASVPMDEALADVRSMGWRDLREKYVGTRPAKTPPAPEPSEPSGALPADAEPILASDLPADAEAPTEAEDEPQGIVGREADDALQAEDEAWEQVRTAIASGQPFPRVAITALVTLNGLYGPRGDE
jgi:hypothetical protein